MCIIYYIYVIKRGICIYIYIYIYIIYNYNININIIIIINNNYNTQHSTYINNLSST